MQHTGLTLQLIHGRTSPDAEMKHWGFDAPPIHGVAFLRGSYLTTFTVGFINEAAMQAAKRKTDWREFDELALEVRLCDSLIHCRDGYYGDFEVYLPPITA